MESAILNTTEEVNSAVEQIGKAATNASNSLSSLRRKVVVKVDPLRTGSNHTPAVERKQRKAKRKAQRQARRK